MVQFYYRTTPRLEGNVNNNCYVMVVRALKESLRNFILVGLGKGQLVLFFNPGLSDFLKLPTAQA